MFNGSPIGLYGTRRLEEEDRDNLHRLQGCPAIFQEYIEGEYDIRVAVVGNDVFAARLSYEPLDDVLDTRFVETSISPCSLPPEIADRLTEFVAGFGLVYSAIDLRYSKERGYVFFESNPEGQYLWIEIEAELPISRAIAERLVNPS
jgi:glutathione synthase/RimK-type ligase-like ATP-grasp enzyme